MDKLLDKYRKGQISPDELDELSAHLEDSSASGYERFLSRQWNDFVSPTDLSPKKKKEFFPLSARSDGKLTVFFGIAALALLLVTVGIGIPFKHQQARFDRLAIGEIVSLSSESGISSVILPDGSKVRLNSRSTIKYTSDFGLGDRTVSVEGECFFDVAKDKSKAFIVNAPDMRIKVYGTKFNVYAYPESDKTEMSLVEGSVSIQEGEDEFIVNPGEKVTVERFTGRLSKMETDGKVETSWLRSSIVFEHDPLEDVFRILERCFAVQIDCSQSINLSDRYTGTFTTRNISDILDILKMHYNFTYTITSNRITITANK